MKRIVLAILVLALPTMAFAQFGNLKDKLGKVTDKVNKANDKASQANKVADDYAPWTPEQEAAIGKESAAKMVHIFGTVDDEAAVQYVSLVGNAVAQAAPRDVQYHFAILNSDAVTAFALPGGYVFVTRGALAAMKNEAELAGVLAHEVAHVDGRHLEKEVRQKKATAWAMQKWGNKIPGPDQLRDIANDMVTSALTSSYSRDKELDADKKGTQFAAAVGYDAGGLRDLLQTLKDRQDDANMQRALGVWNSTHPPLEERIATLSALTTVYPGGETVEERFTKAIADAGLNTPAK